MKTADEIRAEWAKLMGTMRMAAPKKASVSISKRNPDPTRDYQLNNLPALVLQLLDNPSDELLLELVKGLATAHRYDR